MSGNDGSAEHAPADVRRIAAALANDDARALFAEIVLAGRAGDAELPPRRRERALSALVGAGLVSPGTPSVATAEPFRALLARQATAPAPHGPERFVRNGRIDHLPSSSADRAAFFAWLATRVVHDGEALSEPALNERLAAFHDDYALLRRSLVDFGALERTPSGSQYRRPARPDPSARQG